MFSGIVEGLGRVTALHKDGSNQVIWVQSPFQETLHIDQSIAHDGACLTIEEIKGKEYGVTAVEETLKKTSLGALQKGSLINLERSLTLGSYVDGHLVQGHVDAVANCMNKWEADGSWLFQFSFDSGFKHLLVEKGSITINGISLTAFDVSDQVFSVAIIPYTYYHTNIQNVEPGTKVNLEFDLIGKYVQKQMNAYNALNEDAIQQSAS